MTTRNPLVRISGKIVELPTGDVLGGAAQGLGVVFQGTWSSLISYQQNDIVFYNGSSYIALQANSNQTPPTPPASATAYWAYIAWEGSAATVAVGTTTTLAAGSSATVTNSGSSSAAVFNFGIPTGATGATGAAGGWGLFSQITTSASQATVDFTSIPATSSTIKILWQVRCTNSGTANTGMYIRLNNDTTAADYTTTIRTGTQNTTVFSNNVASTTGGAYAGSVPNDGNTAGLFSQGEITINNYANTTFIKRFNHFIGHEDATNGPAVQIMTNRWNSTAAINRVTLSLASGAFKDGSVISLYLLT